MNSISSCDKNLNLEIGLTICGSGPFDFAVMQSCWHSNSVIILLNWKSVMAMSQHSHKAALPLLPLTVQLRWTNCPSVGTLWLNLLMDWKKSWISWISWICWISIWQRVIRVVRNSYCLINISQDISGKIKMELMFSAHLHTYFVPELIYNFRKPFIVYFQFYKDLFRS